MKNSSAAMKQDGQPSAHIGRKPADKFHEGPVHVSIWENEGPRGAFRTASFELRYKDKQQQWQSSHSYGAADLKYVENAAREARTRIETWQQENNAKHANDPRP